MAEPGDTIYLSDSGALTPGSLAPFNYLPPEPITVTKLSISVNTPVPVGQTLDFGIFHNGSLVGGTFYGVPGTGAPVQTAQFVIGLPFNSYDGTSDLLDVVVRGTIGITPHTSVTAMLR